MKVISVINKAKIPREKESSKIDTGVNQCDLISEGELRMQQRILCE